MNVLLIVAGLLLVVAALIDAFWTIVWVDGRAGPITHRLTGAMRRLLWTVMGHNQLRLSAVGPIIMITSITAWAVMVWSGWVLTFTSDSSSLQHSLENRDATLLDRIYVVGSSMATLGVGEFEPTSGMWRLATAVCGLSGFLLVGLAVSYIISLLEAVVQKRSFASQVQSLGKTPEDFVINMWDGRSFRGAELVLLSLMEQVNMVTERHKAYPLLHYFHASTQEQSVPVALAVFDEAITVLSAAIPEEVQPSPAVLHSARSSVRLFLDTGHHAYIYEADELPRRPDTARLREVGIPLVDAELFDASLVTLEYRRRQLLGFVDRDRRAWPDA